MKVSRIKKDFKILQLYTSLGVIKFSRIKKVQNNLINFNINLQRTKITNHRPEKNNSV